MDAQRFDDMVRALARWGEAPLTRRRQLGALVAAAGGSGLVPAAPPRPSRPVALKVERARTTGSAAGARAPSLTTTLSLRGATMIRLPMRLAASNDQELLQAVYEERVAKPSRGIRAAPTG